jgi:hypothetical protein
MGLNTPCSVDRVTLGVSFKVAPPQTITGTAGVWTNVTPAGINLTAGYSQTVVPGNVDDNYGVQDVLQDPANPSHFYAFVCYQGCWKSTNYGLTWTKVSGTSVLDGGKNWGSGIAPDGSYMLNTCGNNFSGSPEVRRSFQRSTNGGVTWVQSADVGGDPYNVTVSPFDNTRVIAATHDNNHLLESTDSGVTWTDHGTVNAAIVHSGYVHYMHNSDTVLYVGQDGENTYRGTKSAGTWTWTQVTDLNDAGHYHGTHQIFHDAVNGAFFHTAGGGSTEGIFKSTNNGVNWTRVYSTTEQTTLTGTPTMLYSMFAGPINGGSLNSNYTTATRNPGTSWAVSTDLSQTVGMNNGAKRIAVGTDGSRHVLVAGCWCAGIWRYIEP